MTQDDRIRELILRLARLDASESWADDLNPAQRAVLDYLSRANRFSRSPSHVADYLSTTRGTVSQTLKSLTEKGYVTEKRSSEDKRVIEFRLTGKGTAMAERPRQLERAIQELPDGPKGGLEDGLQLSLRQMISRNGGRAFGQCRACRHFGKREESPFCGLLAVSLAPAEIDQICHEQEPR